MNPWTSWQSPVTQPWHVFDVTKWFSRMIELRVLATGIHSRWPDQNKWNFFEPSNFSGVRPTEKCTCQKRMLCKIRSTVAWKKPTKPICRLQIGEQARFQRFLFIPEKLLMNKTWATSKEVSEQDYGVYTCGAVLLEDQMWMDNRRLRLATCH